MVILLIVSLLLSAFFSGSEAAFLSLQRGRLAKLIKDKIRGAEEIAKLLEHPEKLLATVLTGNNIVNTAAASIGTALVISIFKNNDIPNSISVLIATIIVSVLLLIFSETIPKTIAVRNSEKVALLAVKALKKVSYLFFPFVWFLEKISKITGRLFGIKDASIISEEEILALIDERQQIGEADAGEAQMLERVFKFNDTKLFEVMTPRTEIVAIDQTSSLASFLEIYKNHTHSRFPIYLGDIENITGTISAKDILTGLSEKTITETSTVADFQRHAYFVPETKLVSELFTEMRLYGYKIALLADEFGGLAGLITLEMLMEEIVGKVGEEGQLIANEIEELGENTFLLDGATRIEDISETINLSIPDGDYETIAGFVLYNLGNIPSVGDSFMHENYRFEITEMKNVRIEQIKITKTRVIKNLK